MNYLEKDEFKEVAKAKKKALTEFMLQKKIIVPGYTGQILVHINDANVMKLEQTIFY